MNTHTQYDCVIIGGGAHDRFRKLVLSFYSQNQRSATDGAAGSILR